MADKREDKGTDEGQEKQKPFIREKIVRQPPSGRQIMRKILMTGVCAVVFGTAAAVCFSAVKPIADRAFGPEETEQEPQIMQASPFRPDAKGAAFDDKYYTCGR